MAFATQPRKSKAMGRLAVIAGQGELPAKIATNAEKLGFEVVVMAISGQADGDFSAFATETIQLGSLGKTLGQIQARDCAQIVMVGKVVRPSLGALKPDATALKLLGKVLTKGDDSLLRVISDFFANAGIETLSPEVFMPENYAAEGAIAGGPPGASADDDIALGRKVLSALGGLDVGQAIVVQNGRVIAIEAAEGTNAMLRRCAALLDPAAGDAVLVKMPKSGQDSKLDVPTIGVETIGAAAQSGITVIAVQAGAVLFADEIEAIRACCIAKGVTLVGFTG